MCMWDCLHRSKHKQLAGWNLLTFILSAKEHSNSCCHTLCPSKLCLLLFFLPQGHLCLVPMSSVCCTSTASTGLLARTHTQWKWLGLQGPAVPQSGSWGTIKSPSWPAFAAATRWDPETCPGHEHFQCSQPDKAVDSQGFVSRFPCLSHKQLLTGL